VATYAIGDIHGCNRTFQALLRQISPGRGDTLVLLGDLIDRGPDSKGVVDTVGHLEKKGARVVCLRGNHEQMLLDARNGPAEADRWFNNGGKAALKSFGAKWIEDIPNAYMNFFEAMPLWYETGGFLCVHGGIDFSQNDPLDDPRSLLWLRQWYAGINYTWLGDRIILHGHTPLAFSEIHAQHAALEQQRYLNLDNGCVYALRRPRPSGLGNLAALHLETKKLFWQKCLERFD